MHLVGCVFDPFNLAVVFSITIIQFKQTLSQFSEGGKDKEWLKNAFNSYSRYLTLALTG